MDERPCGLPFALHPDLEAFRDVISRMEAEVSLPSGIGANVFGRFDEAAVVTEETAAP